MEERFARIDKQTWRVENGHVRFFLLTGRYRALAIDSGMTVRGFRTDAEAFCGLPCSLLNTHADPDHVGANAEFDDIFIHPAELVNYADSKRLSDRLRPIWDGDTIDLGGRPLEVITLPGHTPGSVALLDRDRRMLFPGDVVQDGNVFLFGPYRSLTGYYFSLQKLMRYVHHFDTIYPSHGSLPLPADHVGRLLDGVELLREGKLSFTEGEFRGIPLRVCDLGCGTLLLPREDD